MTASIVVTQYQISEFGFGGRARRHTCPSDCFSVILQTL